MGNDELDLPAGLEQEPCEIQADLVQWEEVSPRRSVLKLRTWKPARGLKNERRRTTCSMEEPRRGRGVAGSEGNQGAVGGSGGREKEACLYGSEYYELVDGVIDILVEALASDAVTPQRGQPAPVAGHTPPCGIGIAARPRRLLTVLPSSSTMAQGFGTWLRRLCKERWRGVGGHDVRHSSELGLTPQFSRRGTSANRR